MGREANADIFSFYYHPWLPGLPVSIQWGKKQMLIYLAFIIIHGYLDYLYPSNGGEKRMLIYLAFIIIHG